MDSIEPEDWKNVIPDEEMSEDALRACREMLKLFAVSLGIE